MKYFILMFIALVVSLFTLTSCGLLVIGFEGSPATKEQRKLIMEYGGLYVFDKALRDEIRQREKEREEYSKSRLAIITEEKEKLLRNFFTEKEIQDFRDMVASDMKRRSYKSYSYHPVDKKEKEIYRELNKKYPDLVDEKFPFDGYEMFHGYSISDFKVVEPYYQKIKEYMGEEIFNKLKPNYEFSYVERNVNGVKKEIVVEMFVTKTWGEIIISPHGDEAAGMKFTDEQRKVITNRRNIFYLIDDKFVKHEREY